MQRKTLIDNFLAQEMMAIAGLSRSGGKFGNIVFKSLSQKGYQLYPIHPEAKEINGKPCVSTIDELPVEVERLLLVVPPTQSEKIVQQIPPSNIKQVWMQQGAESTQAIEFCQEHHIDLVHGECILMFAEPKGLHKVHRWIMELFGEMPK